MDFLPSSLKLRQKEELGHLRLQVAQLTAALAGDFESGYPYDYGPEVLDGSDYDWARQSQF